MSQLELGCDKCRGKTPPVGARCKFCGRMGDPPPAHRCHARCCMVAVKPEMLMCKRHWFMVPLHIRRAVWDTYRQGQCDDKSPSREWHSAASAAIGYVAKQEGHGLTKSEAEALEFFSRESTDPRDHP